MKNSTLLFIIIGASIFVGCGRSESSLSILPEPIAINTRASTTAEQTQQAVATASPVNASTIDIGSNSPYTEISWETLIPEGYSADVIMDKYAERIMALPYDSPEATALYMEMQDEFNNAPINEEVNETLIKLPGFVAPLEYENDLITEFLLVPYFGACIHEPAPPVNQTILVKAAEGEGLTTEESYAPMWIMGEITTEITSTELAQSGYYIQNATIDLYTME